MLHSQPQTQSPRSPRINLVKWSWLSLFLLTALLFAPLLQAQSTVSSPTSPAACPVQFQHFNPSGVTVRIKNVSGKNIVGLDFNVAIADATEHWKWFHWNFDDALPIRDFGWNKRIKMDAAKTLSWDRAYLDFEHGGGGAFVLTSVLFEDGSIWEESQYSEVPSCKYVWHNSHKQLFVRPVQLPFRQ
jgi:hypothetical protein